MDQKTLTKKRIEDEELIENLDLLNDFEIFEKDDLDSDLIDWLGQQSDLTIDEKDLSGRSL